MTKALWRTLTARRPANARRRAHRPAVEALEERCVLDGAVRSISGVGNNLAHPDWGSANVALLRTADAAYADGIDDPTVGSPARPSPRVISNVIVAQTTPERIPSDRAMSAMIYGFGQFLDHDIDLTPNDSPAVAFNITVPRGDPFFDPDGTGQVEIFLNRSAFDPETGRRDPREQINVITAFIDGSQIYGSDDDVASALRTHSGGRLKTSPGADGRIGTQDDLLPYNSTAYFTRAELNDLNMDNPTGLPARQLFAAGDVRANENIELTSLHTLFVREHNRIAGLIQAAAPNLSDEVIYQGARAVVGAELQAITYNEWLPTLLGPGALDAYSGYDSSVNPGIANEFSTALFRLGHSMLGQDVEFFDNDGEEVAEELELRDAFFNPGAIVTGGGIGPILKYLASDPSSEVDNSIVDDVRNFLFGEPGQGGFDLASLNIQRGREHGLADYNTVRAAYGLPRVTRFSDISSDPDVQSKLRQLYGSVNNIDLWVGGLAEDHVPGSSTGPLIRAVIADQFERLRDGDRFWYGRVFSGEALRYINNTSLADVISRNTEIDNLQDNVFFFRLSISGKVFYDADRDGDLDRGEDGLQGRTVQLLGEGDGGFEPVAETTTGRDGSYQFNVADGLGPGTFRVRVLLRSGWVQTSDDPADVTFTRGDQFATNVNFGTVRGAALLAEAGAAGVGEVLTADQVRPMLDEAVRRWQAAGAANEALAALSQVDIQVTDLPGQMLGLATRGAIVIDSNAAGYGWFVDATPGDDGEFRATADGAAAGRMDLLTVVTHEAGHLLGFEHGDGDDVMGETLVAGVRELPAPVAPAPAPAVWVAGPAATEGDGPPVGRPIDVGVSLAVVALGTSLDVTPVGAGGDDRPAAAPLGEDEAAAVLVNDDRRRAQAALVADPTVTGGGAEVVNEATGAELVPTLRPPE